MQIHFSKFQSGCVSKETCLSMTSFLTFSDPIEWQIWPTVSSVMIRLVATRLIYNFVMKLFETSGIQRITFRSRGKQIGLPNPILPASNHILFQVGSSFLATETFRVHGTQQNRKRNYTPACSWRNTLEKSTGRTFISQQLACHASPNLFVFK